MDFRKLNGASFRVWQYFCAECKKRCSELKLPEHRFVRNHCAQQIARELKYNTQTVAQSIHTLKEAGFITEIKDPCNSQQGVYFIHVILMGECIPLPGNVEDLVHHFYAANSADMVL
jgi:hypothetical protein